MSILWVAVMAMGASPLDGVQPSASTTSLAISRSTENTPPAAAEPAPRSGKELADAAHTALAHWAKAKGDDVQAAARDLLGIYREIEQDKKLAVSQRENLRMSVRGRLMQLAADIKRASAGLKTVAPKSVAVGKNRDVLEQGGVAQNGGGAGAGFGGGQNGNNNNADAGQDLVDLIENTISPKQWDINGGNCTIYYWKLQHAIVVRATDDVHADISDALDQLNQAGH